MVSIDCAQWPLPWTYMVFQLIGRRRPGSNRLMTHQQKGSGGGKGRYAADGGCPQYDNRTIESGYDLRGAVVKGVTARNLFVLPLLYPSREPCERCIPSTKLLALQTIKSIYCPLKPKGLLSALALHRRPPGDELVKRILTRRRYPVSGGRGSGGTQRRKPCLQRFQPLPEGTVPEFP